MITPLARHRFHVPLAVRAHPIWNVSFQLNVMCARPVMSVWALKHAHLVWNKEKLQGEIRVSAFLVFRAQRHVATGLAAITVLATLEVLLALSVFTVPLVGPRRTTIHNA